MKRNLNPRSHMALFQQNFM